MEENILDYFEREKAIKLPTHLKNLLLLSGFDNRLSLSRFESEDIQELERIGRETIARITAEPEREKYLGAFQHHPEAFCIFPGHKKLLHELAPFYRNFSHKKRSLEVEMSAAKRVEQPNESNQKNALARPRDVDGEKQNIYTLLVNWIGNFSSRYLTYEEAAHVSREIGKTKVEISEDTNQCFVTCCICLKELKIFRNQNGFWIMSNIHKHFKTHMNSQNQNKKFSKNISISSSISNSMIQESDIMYLSEGEVKQEQEGDFDDN